MLAAWGRAHARAGACHVLAALSSAESFFQSFFISAATCLRAASRSALLIDAQRPSMLASTTWPTDDDDDGAAAEGAGACAWAAAARMGAIARRRPRRSIFVRGERGRDPLTEFLAEMHGESSGRRSAHARIA